MASFQTGDQVVYAMHGVCRILPSEQRIVDRKPVEYYVLEPVTQPGTRYYVPMHNQAAIGKLRKLLTKQELDALLCEQSTRNSAWIENENERKQCYRQLIGSGDRAALLSMIHTLHLHRQSLQVSGKKFHLCDETFLRDAEKLLSSEFSAILGIPESNVTDYVTSYLDK